MQNTILRTAMPPRIKAGVWLNVWRVLLFGAIWFSTWQTGRSTFWMVAQAEQTQILLQYDARVIAIAFQYVMPLMMAAILYGIWYYAMQMTYRGVYRALAMFGATADGRYMQTTGAAVFAVYAAVRGAFSFLFAYYPLLANVGEPIVSFATSVAACGALYALWARKVEKDLRCFVFSAIVFPMAAFLILA